MILAWPNIARVPTSICGAGEFALDHGPAQVEFLLDVRPAQAHGTRNLDAVEVRLAADLRAVPFALDDEPAVDHRPFQVEQSADLAAAKVHLARDLGDAEGDALSHQGTKPIARLHGQAIADFGALQTEVLANADAAADDLAGHPRRFQGHVALNAGRTGFRQFALGGLALRLGIGDIPGAEKQAAIDLRRFQAQVAP